MITTDNYRFNAPELRDPPDIRVLSENWIMIDGILKRVDDETAEVLVEAQKAIAAGVAQAQKVVNDGMAEINRILSEGMIITDPVSLLQVPVQEALNNLYGLHRAEGGLTVNEYAALGLTVDAYRAKGLTVTEYATQGKKRLGG